MEGVAAQAEGASATAAADSALVAARSSTPGVVCLKMKWGGETYPLHVQLTETMEDLRTLIEMETGVRPENQKIFGLRLAGKPNIPADTVLSDLRAKDQMTIKMMGTPDDVIDEIEAQAARAGEHAVLNDFDVDQVLDAEVLLRRDEAQSALRAAIERTNINVMHLPREGKKLLVLDLDHTLLDFNSRHTRSMEELKRPFMDDFLTSCYKHYDLVVWSQTKWHWVEIKLTEMGMVTNPSYSISFALDRACMFKVTREHKGEVRTHEVKALELIWAKFPQWSAKNTVHIDDLARNFALNPQSGLKCSSYRRKRSRAAQDRELVEIAAYLELIAERHDDFTRLDHSKWREVLGRQL